MKYGAVPDREPGLGSQPSGTTPPLPELGSLKRVRVILVSPSHAGNIGSTARAMKTMGLAQLALVHPRYPDLASRPEAIALCAGAEDILTGTTIHTTLSDALAQCRWSAALSGRRRDIGPPPLSLRDAASTAVGVAASGAEAALVFGSERYGLDNEDVSRCQALCTIDTEASFGSLNLAMAVQIAAYECRRAALGGSSSQTLAAPLDLASENEREQLFTHLEQALVAIDFLDPEHSPKLMARLRRLFSRSGLEHDEVNILRGICRSILRQTR